MIVRAKTSLILVGLLLILLPVLAVLQYRWIGEVSAAEHDRLESSLRNSSDRFAADFDSELSRLSSAFQMRDGFPETTAAIEERYQAWVEANWNLRVIRSVYVLRSAPDGGSDFLKVDFADHQFDPEPAPKELTAAIEHYRPGSFNAATGDRLFVLAPIFRPGRQFGGPRSDEFRRRPEGFGRRSNGAERGRGQGSNLDRAPIWAPGQNPGPERPAAGGPLDGEVVLEIDRDAVIQQMVPALVERHFSTHNETAYRIAIVAGTETPRVLYSSAGEWTPGDIATPDAAVHLFSASRQPGFGGRRGGGPRNPFQSSVISEPWQLVVKHREGSLETAVEHVRMRNLVTSFGILLVLGAGLITVVISSQRAHTLGRLQMEFAAGVSHELRTPLAVIRSAAHNLSSGIVRDTEQVAEYAKIVQEEARRLSDMVEEVLLYSETQSGWKKYNLEAVDVNDVVERAIANLAPAVDFEAAELTPRIDPDLPPVKADPAALTQCVQNLLSNAFKYGKTAGKAEIEIAATQQKPTGEVQITVSDHGPGIDRADQRQLFEAFYRGRRVGSNVPGNGLGLHLVKRIMLAQGGRVTYQPGPDGGASFTLHIPVAS